MEKPLTPEQEQIKKIKHLRDTEKLSWVEISEKLMLKPKKILELYNKKSGQEDAK